MFKEKNRLTREFIKFNSLVDEATGCWNWSRHFQSSGYGQFRYNNRNKLAHRASYVIFNDIDHDEVFHLNSIEGRLVCHKCDNPKCVNPAHLFLGTHKENIADAKSKGRLHVQNTDFAFARKRRIKKLSDTDVMAIFNSTGPLKPMAGKYGVSMSQISFIRNGRRKQLVTDQVKKEAVSFPQ